LSGVYWHMPFGGYVFGMPWGIISDGFLHGMTFG
jgi:hypothetical protein